MSQLITTPNMADPDGLYASLLAAHRGLTEAESHAMNARLVLVLANVLLLAAQLGVFEPLGVTLVRYDADRGDQDCAAFDRPALVAESQQVRVRFVAGGAGCL